MAFYLEPGPVLGTVAKTLRAPFKLGEPLPLLDLPIRKRPSEGVNQVFAGSVWALL
jgi:hypothetical protein